jgi:glycosyltransferase involved in cell wall biosynthesis
MTVTVVIPTFNRAAMLADAVRSALAQTRPADEIIIVDDGSTDDTRTVVASFGTSVRCLRQENRGVSAARNAGIEAARGRLIAFLDSDDLWHPFKLEIELEVLARLPGVGLVYSEFEILKPDGSRRPNGSRTWLAERTDLRGCFQEFERSTALGVALPPGVDPFWIYSGLMYRSLLDEALALTSTVVVRREAIGCTRFTEEVSIFEDWEFYSRIARDHQVAFLDVATASNRSHQGTERLTRVGQLVKTQAYLAMVRRVWGADAEFSRRFPDDVRRAEGNALLAVSRAAILSSHPALARASLAEWGRLGVGARRGWARLYAACAAIPGGRLLLRQVLRARTLGRLLAGGASPHPANPAA